VKSPANPEGVFIETSATPVPDGLGVVSVLRDVSERRRAELLLQAHTERIEDLYDNAPCGYHSLDADGRFVTVNDTELEWLGYTRDELLGRSVQDVLFPSARETFAAHYPEFKLRGTLRDLELEMRRKDGSRFWALLNATAVRDEEGGYLRSRSTMFDITDLVQARQEVARRTAALEAANRELESFSYSVSHDLRAPLRAIAGFSSLLASDYSGQLDAEAKGLLDRVCDNTRRMSQLIDDLLAFSGVGRKQMHQGRLSMNGLVAACVAELTAGLDPSRLEIEVGALPDAFGDAAMLRQVWTNLLSNALKFTSQRPRARVLVRGGSVNGERVYSVEDNGVGFDKRYAGKLFGVFQRLHNQREFPGTGVGLALVQRVVERHGGRIWADSRPGEGATFSFALPAPPPESSASD
jgi:PAS domain S-box-containing protein